MKLALSLFLIFGMLFVGNFAEEKTTDSNITSARDNYKPVITDLGEECGGAMDICTDASNTVHIMWSFNYELYYGQIKNNKIVNKEKIPNSLGFKPNMIRPRMTARPDNGNIHITWMTPKPGRWLVHVWKDENGWHEEDVWAATGKDHISVPFAVEDLQGVMHVLGHVWTQGSAVTKVKYWRKAPGGSYNKGWTLVEGPKKWRDTSMFIDRQGGVHGVYKSGSDPGKYNFCESGGTYIDEKIEDIPIPSGNNCVSFGDLFVPDSGDVYHVHMSYKSENIYLNIRNKATGKWGTPIQVSEGPIEVCHKYHKNYENPWPSIAMNPEGVVYMSWADMPCPDSVANRITLAVYENGQVTREIITTDAETDEHSKPAMCGNDNGIYMIWRDWENKNIFLYTEAKASFSIDNFVSNQKVCDRDYTDGTATIKVAVGNPDDFSKAAFYVDGTLLGEDTSAPFEMNWKVSDYAPGNHTLKVVGTPHSGDPLEDEVVVDIDCPPVLELDGLFDNATIYESFTITANVTDDKTNEMNKVDFYIDGTLVATDTSAPFEHYWDTTGLSQGNHTLRVVAYDNSNLSDEVAITVKYLPIFPPTNFKGVRKENRSIFFVNYYNHLTWEQNSKNSQNGITITNFNIYQLADDGSRVLLTTVSSSVYEYDHKEVDKTKEYTYLVTSVDSEGNESMFSKVIVK